MPAHPWTICAYIRTIEKSMTPAVLQRCVRNIGQVHFEKLRKRPDREPMVKKMLESVLARARAEKADKAVPVLFDPDDFLEKTVPKLKKAGSTRPRNLANARGLRANPPLVRRKKV